MSKRWPCTKKANVCSATTQRVSFQKIRADDVHAATITRGKRKNYSLAASSQEYIVKDLLVSSIPGTCFEDLVDKALPFHSQFSEPPLIFKAPSQCLLIGPGLPRRKCYGVPQSLLAGAAQRR